MAIGRRQVADLFRAQPPLHYPLSEGAAVAADPADVPDPTDPAVIRCLEGALSSLTPDQNRLLWYRIVGGWTWSEMGQELGVPRSAAKRRYQRLVRRLNRACLSAESGPSAEG